MTIAKDFASKAVVAFVAFAMIFTMFAPVAKAATTEEMQAQIEALLAQIAALQGGGSSSSSNSSSVCPYTWTRDLKTGASGADVKMLQMFLNGNADTRVAASGVGSAGMETEYFGPATAAAVSKFQQMYRAEVLTPNGLVNPTGYFGPSTRAHANSLCDEAMVDEDEDEDEDATDEEDEEDEDSEELSGEASLEDFEIDDPADTTIEEGQEDAEIAELTVQFENGDAEIDRLDIELLADGQTNTNTVEPWDVFDTLSLWVDGEKVAEEEVGDEDEWLDETDGIFRFSNLGLVARENEDLEITIAATINVGLDSSPAELGDWDLDVNEVRYFDADGVSDDDTSTGDIAGSANATFEIEEEGGDDELKVKSSSNDPDSTTIELEDDETSDFVTIFSFMLDTEDSTNDIKVEDIRVDVDGTENGTTATSTTNLINDAQLVVDGEVYDDVTITHGTTGQFAFDLDDEDFMIEAGESVEVEFQVEFKALAAAFEGATVEATTDTDGLVAEGAETLGSGQKSGSATGEEHTLRSEGAILEIVSVDESLKVNDDTSTADDEGLFTIKFDVTAFETDLFVNKTAASGTAMGTAGASFLVEDSNGSQVGSGTSTASLTSTADTDGTRFRVNEGETETFTLTVEYDPATAGFYQLQLYSFNFNDSNGDPDTAQRALDASDYETDSLSI